MPRLGAAALLVVCSLAVELAAEEEEPRVIRRYDFDDGDTKGAEGTNDGKVEIEEKDTFDGSGKALRITNDKTYLGTSWYQRNPIKENNTTICFAYKVLGINGNLFVQCGSQGIGNLHADVKSTTKGEWAAAAVDLGKLVDWGGKYTNSKGHSLGNIQIYGGIKGGKAVLLLDNVVVFEGEDRKPPRPPEDLSARIEDYRIKLTWRRAEEETIVTRYEVHRGTNPDFKPSAENLIGQTRLLETHDDTISNFGTFYYKTRAIDISGNESEFSPPLRLTLADEE